MNTPPQNEITLPRRAATPPPRPSSNPASPPRARLLSVQSMFLCIMLVVQLLIVAAVLFV